MQPQMPITGSGGRRAWPAVGAVSPTRLITLCSACSRTEQVFSSTTSAVLRRWRPLAKPSRASRPAMAWLS